MTKKLLLYYRALNMSVGDVDMIYECQPELADMTDKEIADKIELVIKYGYPRSDIGVLLQANPTFLLLSISSLEKELIALGEDIETRLKEDPFLI